MAARGCRAIHDIQQAKNTVPLITREITFGQHVSKLVLGVNTSDLDLGVQIISAKQPSKRDSVGSWHVSHYRTSSFDEHLDHCLVLFKNVNCASSWEEFAFVCRFGIRVSSSDFFLWWSSWSLPRYLQECKLCFQLRRTCVCLSFSGYVSHRWTSTFWSLLRFLRKCTTETRLEKNVRSKRHGPHRTIAQHLGFASVLVWMCLAKKHMSRICCQILDDLVSQCCLSNETLQSPHPINREQVVHPFAVRHPTKQLPISVELWDTDVCFLLHIQPTGDKMFDYQGIRKIPPEVDFEPSRSPAKSVSRNKPHRECRAVWPTWQYCRKSLAWWM